MRVRVRVHVCVVARTNTDPKQAGSKATCACVTCTVTTHIPHSEKFEIMMQESERKGERPREKTRAMYVCTYSVNMYMYFHIQCLRIEKQPVVMQTCPTKGCRNHSHTTCTPPVLCKATGMNWMNAVSSVLMYNMLRLVQ